MNPTPETLGKAKGKISAAASPVQKRRAFLCDMYVQYINSCLRIAIATVPVAKCSFKGLTYAGCVDTRTRARGGSFLHLRLHFYRALLNPSCQDFFLQRPVAAGCCQLLNFPLASRRAAQLLHFSRVYAQDPALPLCFCSAKVSSPARSSGAIALVDGSSGRFVIIKLLLVRIRCKTGHESNIS